MLYDETKKHYGSTTAEAVKAFQHEVGICIDCMLQDDACGQTMVFARENGKLVPKVVGPDAIDLNNLQQYEMILFDGGNSAGDMWKHTFFPKQLQDYFVDENPLPRKETPACNMEVSLDGGLTYQPAPSGVRVVFKDVLIDDENGFGEVHVNATHEGLITDVWGTGECDRPGQDPMDFNIGTESVLIEDLVSRIVND